MGKSRKLLVFLLVVSILMGGLSFGVLNTVQAKSVNTGNLSIEKVNVWDIARGKEKIELLIKKLEILAQEKKEEEFYRELEKLKLEVEDFKRKIELVEDEELKLENENYVMEKEEYLEELKELVREEDMDLELSLEIGRLYESLDLAIRRLENKTSMKRSGGLDEKDLELVEEEKLEVKEGLERLSEKINRLEDRENREDWLEKYNGLLNRFNSLASVEAKASAWLSVVRAINNTPEGGSVEIDLSPLIYADTSNYDIEIDNRSVTLNGQENLTIVDKSFILQNGASLKINNIKISNINPNNKDDYGSAIIAADPSENSLILGDNNEIKNLNRHAAISVPYGKSLNIIGDGNLRISGDGTIGGIEILEASGVAASIGGDGYKKNLVLPSDEGQGYGNIKIGSDGSGPRIDIDLNKRGAAIGSGGVSDGSNLKNGEISIAGKSIIKIERKKESKDAGAAIGTGYVKSNNKLAAGNINILENASVTIVDDKSEGIAIGDKAISDDQSNIRIEGEVKLKSYGGINTSNGSIDIKSNRVSIEAENAAAIGSFEDRLDKGKLLKISIVDSDLKGLKSKRGALIGNGQNSDIKLNINIKDTNLDLENEYGAVIGGGYSDKGDSSAGTIVIDGGLQRLYSKYSSAIGGGYSANHESLKRDDKFDGSLKIINNADLLAVSLFGNGKEGREPISARILEGSQYIMNNKAFNDGTSLEDAEKIYVYSARDRVKTIAGEDLAGKGLAKAYAYSLPEGYNSSETIVNEFLEKNGKIYSIDQADPLREEGRHPERLEDFKTVNKHDALSFENSDLTYVKLGEEKKLPVKGVTVKFESNGGTTIKEQVIDKGSQIAEPESPKKTGYKFIAWYENEDFGGAKFDFTSPIDKDLTLYAKWEKVENPDLEIVEVIFDANGGKLEGEVKKTNHYRKTDKILAPTEPRRQGHKFKYWSVDKAGKIKYNFGRNASIDLLLYAQWEKVENPDLEIVQVIFDPNGGKIEGEAKKTEHYKKTDKILEPVEPRRNGYKFKYWSVDKAGRIKYNFGRNASIDLLLYAQWEEVENPDLEIVQVIFDPTGGKIEGEVKKTEHYRKTDKILAPTEPRRQGHKFKYWSVDKAGKIKYNFGRNASIDLLLYAQWEKVENPDFEIVEVIFDPTGGKIEGEVKKTEHYRKTDKILEPTAPRRQGHKFKYWSVDKAGRIKYNFGRNASIDLLLYAQWEKVENPDLEIVEVIFDPNGGKIEGEAKKTNHYRKTDKILAPVEPRRNGYKFKYWSVDKAGKLKYDFGRNASIDLLLYAQWEKVENPDLEIIQIIFDANGGKLEADDLDKKGPEKPLGIGYRALRESRLNLASSMTPLLLDLDRKEEVDRKVEHYKKTEKILEPEEPKREGYRFKYWSLDRLGKIKYSFGRNASIDLLLYAQWEDLDKPDLEMIEIIFDANGGNIEGESKRTEHYQKTDKILEPIEPRRKGYSFKYWSVDKVGRIKYDFGRNASIDLTLYAQWEKLDDLEPEDKPDVDKPDLEKPDIDGWDQPSRPEEDKLNKEDHLAYIRGYKDNRVRPEKNLTREEAVAILDRVTEDRPMTKRIFKYGDIAETRWSYMNIQNLSNKGAIKGYKDRSFKPNRNISRAEAATMLVRLEGLEPSKKEVPEEIKNHWAAENIMVAIEKGWLKGYQDGTIRPDREITRAEFVTILNKVLEREVRKENILKNITDFKDLKKSAWYYEDMVEATNSHSYDKERLEDGSELWLELIEDR